MSPTWTALAITWLGAAVAMIGAGVGVETARRRKGAQTFELPRSPTQGFVAAALFAAMAAAMGYQAVSEHFPPSFVGAGVFLAGTVIALWWAFRRARA
jgi:hypothetical protein